MEDVEAGAGGAGEEDHALDALGFGQSGTGLGVGARIRPPLSLEPRRGRRHKLRVLGVDAEGQPRAGDAAQSLGLLLELSGHEVAVAHDGLAALTTAEVFQPQVVLLDIGLPGMDGYEVARRLRENPLLEHMLLVALTGYGSEKDRLQSEKAGIDYHLVKPADPWALEKMLAGA